MPKDQGRPGRTEVIDSYEIKFQSITPPRFEIPEVEDPKLKVPKNIHSNELDIFRKECQLTGWGVEKYGRRNMTVSGEGETAFYRRFRKVWVRQGVYGFQGGKISFTERGALIFPPSYAEPLFPDPGPRF